MSLLVVRIVDNPSLAKLARRYLTHLGDGLLVGTCSARVRNQLLDHLSARCPPGRYFAAWSDPTTPQGWTASSTEDLHTLDGIIVGITNQ